MGCTYESLYGQDDAADIGFSAAPRSESKIDIENSKSKPLAYRSKIKKVGSKPKKQKNSDGSRQVDGVDRFPPFVG